jgi:Uma2 family endonuclease
MVMFGPARWRIDMPPVDGTGARKDDERYTYRDYRTWPATQPCELIGGRVYDMSPAPRPPHQALVLQIAAQLDAFFAGKSCRPHIGPIDVFLSHDDEPIDEVEHVVQPDALVVCDESRLIAEGVRGAPDFVIEVLSTSTAFKDQGEKRNLYEAFGVLEYWIVNPETLEVLVYLLRDRRYGLPVAFDLREAVAVSTFPGFTLRVRPEDLR